MRKQRSNDLPQEKRIALFRDNLEHDIDASKSKFIVKANKVVLKLRKVKGEYGYESWQGLTSNKTQSEKAKVKADPTAGIIFEDSVEESGEDTSPDFTGYFLVALVSSISNLALIRATWGLAG